MDELDKLVVNFHFNGESFFMERHVMSYIDREKVFLIEIRGQAKDNCEVAEGKSVTNELRVLHGDKSCHLMSDYTTKELVDIEEINAEANKDDVASDFEDELKEISVCIVEIERKVTDQDN
uniref:Uncharacterized protein n=1 Tax=Oryza punctata TaxID=4537 RepID=A0A0E0LJG4_ORYPU